MDIVVSDRYQIIGGMDERRPAWSRTGTVAEITGTTNPSTGTMAEITGTRWVVVVSDPMAHLLNLRKDARANAEVVLHEIIADDTATIPDICVRIGMTPRTINNALVTLRETGIIREHNCDLRSDKVGCKGIEDGAKGREVGPNGAKVIPKGQEVGPKDVKVGSEVDFDILMPDARKDFKETCRQVWGLLIRNETLLQIEVSERLKIAHSTVKSAYAALMNAGLLNKQGEGRGSKWIVVRSPSSAVKEG